MVIVIIIFCDNFVDEVVIRGGDIFEIVVGMFELMVGEGFKIVDDMLELMVDEVVVKFIM